MSNILPTKIAKALSSIPRQLATEEEIEKFYGKLLIYMKMRIKFHK